MKPRVLQVIPALSGSGGPERGTVDLAVMLKKQGYENIVVSNGGYRVEELERNGITHIKLPVHSKNPFIIRKNAKALEKIIREHQINIVHARSRAPAYSAKSAAKKTGAVFITTFHGQYGLGPLGIKKLYNEVMAEGKIIIAPSEFIKKHIMKEYKVPEKRIRVILRGIDLVQFDPAKVHFERVTALFKKWSLKEDETVIMLPGRLSPMKGADLLIDALKDVKTKKKLRCLLVGDSNGKDDFVSELNRKIRKYKLESVVQLTGNCTDMPAALMNADIVVIPSIYPEAFGRLTIEAQAMGRVVIASGHGGSKEIIKPGENGFLFPPGDIPTLKFYLEKVLNMPENERKKIMAEAIKSVRRNYSTEKMCKETISVYEEVLSNE